MTRYGIAAVVIGAAIGAGGILAISRRPGAGVKRPSALRAASPLANADTAYAAKPHEATNAYEAFVAKNAESRDPLTRDRVGAARMRLGYLAAKRKDLPAAREAFLAAAKTAGTGSAGAFGTVGDQAAYQAVVCLAAEGKRAEAEEGFVALLRDRPLSPLARAAYRRLKLLNGGAGKPAWDALLQTAVDRQEARVRFETSVCGPKCLERILRTPGAVSGEATPGDSSAPSSTPTLPSPKGEGPSYKELAKLCGTTDAGTTVEGMRKGLRAVGRESWAVRLDRRDLACAKLPAVLLQGDHYVVLERIVGDKATVWDPRFKGPSAMPLPPLDDPDFTATLILLAKPEGL